MKEKKYQVDSQTSASHQPYRSAQAEYPVEAGEYLGVGRGLNGDIVVKVKAKIESVTVIDEAETVGIGDLALDLLPQEMVRENQIDVDAVSGATVTSQGLKEAVTQAVQSALHMTQGQKTSPHQASKENLHRPKAKKAWEDMTMEEKTQVMAADISGHIHP